MTQPLDVLVVEDTPDVQNILRMALTSRGHRVVVCDNGQEALTLCIQEHKRFDLIFMDVLMPVMDGITATRLLRAEPAFKDTMIVCLSAIDGRTGFGPDVHDLFDHVAAKPFSPRELLDEVDELRASRGLAS